MRGTTSAPRAIVAAEGLDDLATVEHMLADAGYQVTSIDDGRLVMRTVDAVRPDVILVGAELPGVAATEVCRRIRVTSSTIPIAVLANCSRVDIHVRSLDAGADDFITIPVTPVEFQARIRALRRRAGTDPSPTVELGDVKLDTRRRTVVRAGTTVDLTATEYAVLELLMRNADVVLERSTVYERIWGVDLHTSSKSLDVHVGAVRRKLERLGDRMIHNVRGVGYVIWSTPPTG